MRAHAPSDIHPRLALDLLIGHPHGSSGLFDRYSISQNANQPKPVLASRGKEIEIAARQAELNPVRHHDRRPKIQGAPGRITTKAFWGHTDDGEKMLNQLHGGSHDLRIGVEEGSP